MIIKHTLCTLISKQNSFKRQFPIYVQQFGFRTRKMPQLPSFLLCLPSKIYYFYCHATMRAHLWSAASTLSKQFDLKAANTSEMCANVIFMELLGESCWFFLEELGKI